MSRYSHKAMMAQLHIAPKELGMDDDTRRDFIAARFKGKRSSKDLTFNEKFALLQAFKDAGWKPKQKSGTRNSKKPSYEEKQSRYMIALWNDLYKMKKVRSKTNVSFEAWIAGQINRPEQQLPKQINPDKLTASQRNKLTEQLKEWVNR